ncbi:MAG: transcription antitermination factor NusB [Candidatus Liberibacter europaeus]|uniref:Transcription antitermination protein NusB n=1 Tax=Candidatus Liberibacter europaeus TaxID=744859 RepID=A0A2T4VXU3_9HYPH|nr:transcription antitermination factor NusB [Candidatus Liberibacter europaeus]PTL86588.1 MAG: transcription antitermination factor NusB [Candidatus Liberibacter europaeus]
MDTQSDKANCKFAHKRRIARLSAIQALYKINIVNCSAEEVIDEYELYRFCTDIDEDIYTQVDLEWFRLIIRGVLDNQEFIDSAISSCLADGWSLSRLDLIVCCILRAGLFELIGCSSVPTEVVMSEYIAIAHAFFYRDEPKFINAILDRLSRIPEVIERRNHSIVKS